MISGVVARRLRQVAIAAVVLGVGYAAATLAQVWFVGRAASGAEPSQPAGAIIVLGAAQYDGDPSPVLAARLDHGLALWEAGVAPIIVVTGGRQVGDRFTEATAGADYLLDRGVPDAAILREVDGTSTYESLAASARFLRRRGIDRVVVVSDRHHSARVSSVAAEVGLDTEVSAAPGGSATIRDLMRETAALGLGRLVGHRRLSDWLG